MNSEDLHSRAFDRFVSNCFIKTGYGLLVGAVFSLTIMRRRTFPLYLGSGVGLGYSLSDYNKDLKSVK